MKLYFFLTAVFFNTIIGKTQESYTGPYTGNEKFNIGDLVEATYAGTWTKAMVVGVNPAQGKYKIHFEGEKYCNNHALDGELSKDYVRPRKTMKKVDKPKNEVDLAEEEKPKEEKKETAIARKYKIGDVVNYTNVGSIWLPGAKIEAYNPATRMYTVRFNGGSGDILPCYNVSKPGSFNNDFYIGKWEIHINASLHSKVEDNKTVDVFSGGKKIAYVDIKPNGTYRWVEGRKIINGKWADRKDVPGITLLKGSDKKDWTVYEKTEGYAPTAKTRDEIGFHHLPTSTGYYSAYRVGANKSCVLTARRF